MTPFSFKETRIPGLFLLDSFSVADNRGWFIKDYAKEIFREHGISHDLAEVFYTKSYAGVIRGLHFQRVKQQAKLVRCVAGRVWDVVVDLRKDSKTFKDWIAFDLDAAGNKEVLIPTGCAHGYLVLENSIVSYKCGERFYGEYDDGILWNDQDLGVDWPLHKIGGANAVILSDKDKGLQTFSELMEHYDAF